MTIVLAGVAALTYAVFASSIVLVFRQHDSASPAGLRLIKFGAVATAVCEVWAIVAAPPPTATRTAIALAAFAGSLALYAASAHANRGRPLTLAFSSDVPVHLVEHGPYRIVRHPFYAAYLLSYLAGWVGSWNHWLWLAIAAMLTLYAAAATREERKFLGSEFASAYEAYKARTGMLIPTFGLGLGTRSRS